jgi:hypothetical protein
LSDHFVEFYEDESALVGSIRTYIAKGLELGDAAVVIAQPSRLDALEFLVQASLTMRDARQNGRLILLDAEETLGLFMDGDEPNAARFERSMSEIVDTVREPGTDIRAFGEMVAVLWAHGNVAGALALEDLWNDFIEKHSLRLFCAYPFEAVSQIHSGLDAVCDRHSHILVPPNRELSP